jgi:hypothetical protein
MEKEKTLVISMQASGELNPLVGLKTAKGPEGKSNKGIIKGMHPSKYIFCKSN